MRKRILSFVLSLVAIFSVLNINSTMAIATDIYIDIVFKVVHGNNASVIEDYSATTSEIKISRDRDKFYSSMSFWCIGSEQVIEDTVVTLYMDGEYQYSKTANVFKIVYPVTEQYFDLGRHSLEFVMTHESGQTYRKTYTINVVSGSVTNNSNPTTSFGSTVSDWAKEEVEEAYDEGLVPEVLEGKDLTQKVNRAEFAAIAVALYEELSGKRATVGYNPFYDISGNVCKDDILKAYNLDITVGTSNTTFEPNVNISREQVATMLTRAYKKSEFPGWTIETDDDYALNYMGVKKFADDAQISGYAKESVYFMVKWGIIEGVGDNKFAPKGSVTLGESYGFATREQAVVIALRSKKHL